MKITIDISAKDRDVIAGALTENASNWRRAAIFRRLHKGCDPVEADRKAETMDRLAAMVRTWKRS